MKSTENFNFGYALSYLYMCPRVFPASCFRPSLLAVKPGSFGVSMFECDGRVGRSCWSSGLHSRMLGSEARGHAGLETEADRWRRNQRGSSETDEENWKEKNTNAYIGEKSEVRLSPQSHTQLLLLGSHLGEGLMFKPKRRIKCSAKMDANQCKAQNKMRSTGVIE